MKKPGWVAAWAALTAFAIGVRAQAPVRLLHVVALDKAGQPVTDLKAGDLRLADDGKPQSIVSLRLNDARTGAAALPHLTIILFDLLNDNNIVTAARGSDDVMPTAGLCRVGGLRICQPSFRSC